MRKIIFGIMLAALVGFATYSCDELLGLVNFDGEYYEMEFTIEPTDVLGMQTFDTETFVTDIDSILTENGLSRDQLDSVTVKDAVVEMISQGVTFDFVDALEVTLSSPGFDPIMIAWVESISEGATSITLDLSTENIKDILLATEFTLSTKGDVVSAIEEAIAVKAKVKFHFKGGGGDSGFGL